MAFHIISSYTFIFLSLTHTVKSSVSPIEFKHARGVVHYPNEMVLPDPKYPGRSTTLKLEEPPASEKSFDPSSVKYYVSKKSQSTPEVINLGALNISNKDIYTDGKWYFGFHGWRGSYKDSPIMPELVTAIHNLENATIIHIDWEEGASSSYFPKAAKNLRTVAIMAADVINTLVSKGLAKKENIHLIGFSLGGHVVGFIGKHLYSKYKWKPPRITGLDPAGPLFMLKSATERLDRTDGDYVEVVHSCGDILGIWEAIGHVDIYLNKGRSPQPGCGLIDVFGSCSHQFAKETYAKYTHKSMKALKCKSFSVFFQGNCAPDLTLGCTLGFKYPECTHGVYHLPTNNYQLKGARCATCFGSYTVVDS